MAKNISLKKTETAKWLIILSIALSACSDGKKPFDATGSFETEETIISAEATGVIRQFDIEEGQILYAGQPIGYIDSTQLFLKKKQLEKQVVALLGKKPDITVQLSALREQLKTAETEKIRISNLVEGNAATTKQLDDINAQIELLKKQIDAQKSQLKISSDGFSRDAEPLQAQIEQLDDRLLRCKLTSPLNGTVIAKYARANELTADGKPLYKIADLSEMILRVYITGDQLPKVKINQKVKVFTDNGNGGYTETEGVITWISSKSEFTPKTIQTKNERANLVYAVKVKVRNEGYLKIGMYGQILIDN
ncbi:MAG: HlyD family efflux transporter periplasmic adaptor subunit [Prevotellaceae bacterium]|jgi:HlyD family secretion protein|nr:HlyD family efflux transporter periplasmic adaptor subunit [Prevotellaceae bacterium]